jgi:glycosyltransferase involved in cell wall biosynthesis
MRILMILESFAPVGGVAELVDSLAGEFNVRGHAVALVSTPVHVIEAERPRRAGVEYVGIRIPRRKPVSWRHPERFFLRPIATQFIDFLRTWRPDIVNFQGGIWDRIPAALSACRRAGTAVVASIHDLANGLLVPSGQASLLNTATATIFLSQATKNSFERVLPAARNGRVIVGGVDCASGENAVPYNRARPYILCAARFNLQHKAIDASVRALASIASDYPDVDLLIAGDGPDRHDLIRVIVDAGMKERVELVGAVSREHLWSLYKGALFFAMPSRKPEGLGLAFLESMACGRPVIGTDSGGTPEIVPNGETGLLLDTNDPNDIAAAMRTLLDNPAERERMGRAGWKYAQRFSWSAVADRYLEVFAESLDARSITCGS